MGVFAAFLAFVDISAGRLDWVCLYRICQQCWRAVLSPW